MIPVSMRASLSLSLLLVLAVTSVACTPAVANNGEQGHDLPGAPAGGAGSQPGAGNPDQPVDGGPVDPAEPPPLGDQAMQVKPEPGIVDARPHAWDHINVAPDGRTITVYYWGGVQDCYGLAGVEVERDADGLLVVTVFEGRRGDLPPDTACIEIALLKSVTLELDAPIVAPGE